MRVFVLAALVAAPAYATQPLGPAGTVPTEPFALTENYRDDFETASVCSDAPKGKVVSVGQKAVYVKHGPDVEVMLDEYARRFVLDYCQ